MISIDKFCMENSIRVDKLLEKFDLPIENIEQFLQENYETIQNKINEKLISFREENIKIDIDNEDDFKLKITDTIRNIESKNELTKYFNEAKLNLIVLLLLFESIKKANNEGKKRILVLDDFITSLDISNRTFLMRYILDNFSNFQLLIFTHNVYFYNLIMYLVNDIYKISSRWKFANLYEINNQHKLYIKGSIERVRQIRQYYQEHDSGIDTIGNKIRQRFEILLYEFSKLIMVGAVEDSKKIIERIENSKNIYYKTTGSKTASDLIDELEQILNEENPHNLKTRIKGKIAPYKHEFNKLKNIIRELKLYQKVTMHPMSHGTIGQSSFTTNEIEESLDLLQKFENYIKDLADSNIDGA